MVHLAVEPERDFVDRPEKFRLDDHPVTGFEVPEYLRGGHLTYREADGSVAHTGTDSARRVAPTDRGVLHHRVPAF